MLQTQESAREKYIWRISLFLLLIPFFICYLYFAFCSRFTADDYSLMALHRQLGIFRFPVWFYMNQEGCFSGWIYSTFMVKFMLSLSRPLIYLILFFIFSAWCQYRALRRIFLHYIGGFSVQTGVYVVAIILASYYLTSYGTAETFYWCVGSGYLVYGSLFLYAFSVFITTDNRWQLGICYLAFFVFGMSRLNFISTAGTLLGFFILYELIWKKTWSWKYVLALIVLCAGLVIYVVAPGNYIRRGSSDLPSFQIFFSNISHVFAHFFLIKFKLRPLLQYLCLVAPAYFIGSHYRERITKIYPHARRMIQMQLLFGALLGVIVLVNSAAMAVAESGIAHDRVNLLVDIMFVVLLVSAFLHAGAYWPIPSRFLWLVPVCGILSSAFFLIRLETYRESARQNAKADDLRIEQIKQTLVNMKTTPVDTLFLEPLPTCGMLYDWDLKKLDGKSGWGGLNNGLMLFFQTPFKIDSGSVNRNHGQY